MDHYSLDDEQFEQQFVDCTFPSAYFNHEAHIRLAWIHLDKYGLDKAIENINKQIRNYAVSLGEADKYHKTLTIAAVHIVYRYFIKSNTSSFEQFICLYPELNSRFKEIILEHYSDSLLTNQLAKDHFISPDILAF